MRRPLLMTPEIQAQIVLSFSEARKFRNAGKFRKVQLVVHPYSCRRLTTWPGHVVSARSRLV